MTYAVRRRQDVPVVQDRGAALEIRPPICNRRRQLERLNSAHSLVL
jgi:hypothetical protein